DPIIKTLLRSYTGLFDGYVVINEKELARRAEINLQTLQIALKQMQEFDLIDYIPVKNKPQLSFIGERLQESNIHIDRNYLKERKKVLVEKIHAVIAYAERQNICRSQFILRYFGEQTTDLCGTCDYCRSKKQKLPNSKQFVEISEKM